MQVVSHHIVLNIFNQSDCFLSCGSFTFIRRIFLSLSMTDKGRNSSSQVSCSHYSCCGSVIEWFLALFFSFYTIHGTIFDKSSHFMLHMFSHSGRKSEENLFCKLNYTVICDFRWCKKMNLDFFYTLVMGLSLKRRWKKETYSCMD